MAWSYLIAPVLVVRPTVGRRPQYGIEMPPKYKVEARDVDMSRLAKCLSLTLGFEEAPSVLTPQQQNILT